MATPARQIRLADEEYDQARYLAKRLNLTFSELVRQLLTKAWEENVKKPVIQEP